MAGHLARVQPGFESAEFISLALEGFEGLELKQRSAQITKALDHVLPQDFQEACAIMVAALHTNGSRPMGDLEMDENGISGWSIMPMADVVAQRGMAHFDVAMETLGEMTKRFSAEFAVRPLILHEQEQSLKWALKWAKADNVHLRRLASEGWRPRLPWGVQLRPFVDDPSPLLPILETLRDDKEEYVRRSVANSLNDIAKDHPDLVADIAANWLNGASKNRERLVKHGCRSLVKAGHAKTLKSLGYGAPQVTVGPIALSAKTVNVGESLGFELKITSAGTEVQPVIVDYVIHHRKSNGETSPKTFKGKIAELKPGESLILKKSHSFKKITTRVYHPGQHFIEVLVNGQPFSKTGFDLNA